MKKVILIPDSFKGTMSSAEICEIMAERVHAHWPGAETVKIPVADGGEGSVDAFVAAMGGEKVPCRVTGPRGLPCDAFYGMIGDTAVVEMAAAAGLPMMGEGAGRAGGHHLWRGRADAGRRPGGGAKDHHGPGRQRHQRRRLRRRGRLRSAVF